MNKDEAVQDFMRRIEHYNSMYETLDHQIDKELSYIQIFNQGERFMVHKLAGRASAGACYGSCGTGVSLPSFVENNLKITSHV